MQETEKVFYTFSVFFEMLSRKRTSILNGALLALGPTAQKRRSLWHLGGRERLFSGSAAGSPPIYFM